MDIAHGESRIIHGEHMRIAQQSKYHPFPKTKAIKQEAVAMGHQSTYAVSFIHPYEARMKSVTVLAPVPAPSPLDTVRHATERILNDLELVQSSVLYRQPKDRKLSANTRMLYETPNEIAKFMGHLVQEFGSGQVIEPMGGRGAISQYLPQGTIVIERDFANVAIGNAKAEQCIWYLADILQPVNIRSILACKKWQCMVSNPEYTNILEIMVFANHVIENGGLLVMIAPTDFFESAPHGTECCVKCN